MHTNAIYGFQLMLSHLLERVEPSHILVAFDAGKTTFVQRCMRTIRVVGLRHLMSFVSNFLSFVSCWIIWGIRHYELAQYEADDIIGTLDKLAEQDGFDITICQLGTRI